MGLDLFLDLRILLPVLAWWLVCGEFAARSFGGGSIAAVMLEALFTLELSILEAIICLVAILVCWLAWPLFLALIVRSKRREKIDAVTRKLTDPK